MAGFSWGADRFPDDELIVLETGVPTDLHISGRFDMQGLIVVYALPLFVSLALAAFEPVWGAAAFIAMSVLVVLTTVDTGRRLLRRGASGNSTALVVNQWVCTAAVVALVALPWIIGGWLPSATAYVPSLIIALAAGFCSTAALIMRQFDVTAAMADSGAERD